MRTLRCGLLLLLLTGCTVAQEHLPVSRDDVRALLEEVMRNQRRSDSQLSEYTAHGKQVTRQYDEKGKITAETIILSESYQSSRRNVEVVLSKNGKPLAANKVKKEREQAVEKLLEDEQRRLQTATEPVGEGPEFGTIFGLDKTRVVRLSTYEIFRACDFFDPRRELLNGRETILLDFRPRADFQPQDHRLNPLRYLAGTVWIDAAEKITAKLVAYVITDQQRETPAFQYVSSRRPDGVWLATRVGFNASVNPAAFNGLNLEWLVERTHYQRFTAQAGEVKLTVPKQQL